MTQSTRTSTGVNAWRKRLSLTAVGNEDLTQPFWKTIRIFLKIKTTRN